MSLRLKDVRKTFVDQDGSRLPILGIPEFALQTGEQVALVGESGGGKTTLLNVISGITTPDSGQVIIGNTDLTKLSEPARDRFRALKIGFIFQTFNLLPAFTAVARSLVNRPALLLADEPTASVDAKHQTTVLELIRDTCREHNCALLLVTHSTDVAEQFQRVERLKDFNHPQ